MWALPITGPPGLPMPKEGPQIEEECCAPLHEECLQHHGHKGDLGVTPRTCGAIGERAQVILMWVRAMGVENTSLSHKLGVTR